MIKQFHEFYNKWCVCCENKNETMCEMCFEYYISRVPFFYENTKNTCKCESIDSVTRRKTMPGTWMLRTR